MESNTKLEEKSQFIKNNFIRYDFTFLYFIIVNIVVIPVRGFWLSIIIANHGGTVYDIVDPVFLETFLNIFIPVNFIMFLGFCIAQLIPTIKECFSKRLYFLCWLILNLLMALSFYYYFL